MVVYVRDGFLALDYLAVIVPTGLLAGVGIYLRKNSFDKLLAAWLLFTVIALQFISRMTG